MTTVAVLNMVCGALFSLVGALMFFGGRFIPFSNAEGSGPPGGFVQFVGLGTAAVNFLLMLSGFGIIRLAGWGRVFGIVAASLGGIVYGAALIGLGLQLFFAVALAYCCTVLVLLFSPAWTAVFQMHGAPPRPLPGSRPSDTPAPGRLRDAA